MQIVIGIILSILVSAAAWRMGSLSTSGAVWAAITGGVIFGLGGLPWAVLLLIFFVSSSLLSKAFRRQKRNLSEKFSKGSRRDWGQVLANGGAGTLLVLLFLLLADSPWVWVAYAGAMATANADTWATEIGVLNPRPPRLVTSGRPVEPGTSGGISPYGTLATLAGAALIGLAGAAFTSLGGGGFLWVAVTLGGVCGSLFDSLLGATVQAIYHCPACDKETERHPLHSCGKGTVQMRGWGWLSNDWVNFLASVLGALAAAATWSWLP